MKWIKEQDYAWNGLLLSAVFWELMQLKLAGGANTSSSAESDDDKAAMPRHLGH